MIHFSILRAIWQRNINTCAFVTATAFCLALGGCGSDQKTKPTAAVEAHDHDHDSTPGHSHDDGHDHDHTEDDHAESDEHDHESHTEEEHDHEGHDHSEHEGHDHDHESTATATAVPIPPLVRENLGITFAHVEMRRVSSTMRLPGRFEARPNAMRDYHAPLAGRVELLVNQYDSVTTGTPLYRLDSREWRSMQQELLTLEAEVAASSASLMTAQIAREGGEMAEGVTQQRIDAADAHIASIAASIKVAEERERQVMRLHELVGGRLSDLNEARSQLATLRNEHSQAREDRAELEQQRLQLSTEGGGGAFGTTETLKASLTARRAEYQSARARRDLLRASLSSIGGLPPASAPEEQTLQITPQVTIYASAAGVVQAISATSGGYVDSTVPVLSTVDPSALRFRAVALQSDILRLDPKMPGKILRPGDATVDLPGTSIPVTATLALEADPEKRTLDLVADVAAVYPWARPGVSTDLELVLDTTEAPEPSIPAAAVIQDGLDKVYFLRDPDNPDQALRTVAELGASDGKWVVLKSGAHPHDEIVLDGVYELKLATAAAPQKAGHFHSDGTFHEGED